MRTWLLASSGPLGWALIGIGAITTPFLVAAGSAPNDYVQGGIAVAAITFAGAAMRYFGSQVDKERARGDRLELALIDKVLPALAAASTAMTQAQEAIKEMRGRS